MNTMSKDKNKCPNYNCLFRVPNTDDNLAIIKEVRKMMKDYGTRWRIIVRGRKPISGKKYSYGGGLKIENAQEKGIYIALKPEVADQEWQRRQASWSNWTKQATEKERELWNDRLYDIRCDAMAIMNAIDEHLD